MNDVWEYEELNSTMKIRTLSNKMEGVFVLYQRGQSEIDSKLTIRIAREDSIKGSIGVRASKTENLNATLDIKYRGDSEIGGFLEVVGSSYLESYMEVRPNNRMFGLFEILPPPRKNVEIVSTEDSTTRSRSDLRTINYGDSQRMMIGNSLSSVEDEYLESFIKFDNVRTYVQDMLILEKANMRLYYVGDLTEGTNIELQLPDSKWFEMGITDANKPNASGFVTNKYTINRTDRYIEFDLLELFPKWVSGVINNLGLIIRSSDSHSTSFYTREGRFKPVINVSYITNQVQSMGRTEINSTMFIFGSGKGDLNSTLTVHSDYGFDETFTGFFQVHRPEVPVTNERNAFFIVSKPEQQARMTIAQRDEKEIDATISVQIKTSNFKDSTMTISKPELASWLTVDPNISLKSTMTISRKENSDINSFLGVSREALDSHLFIRAYGESEIDATLTVKSLQEEDFHASLAVSRDSVIGHMHIRAYGEHDFNGSIGVRVKDEDDFSSFLTISREALDSSITIRGYGTADFNGHLSVQKHEESIVEANMAVSRPEINAFMIIRALGESDMNASIEVPHYHYVESHMGVTRPELQATLEVRVPYYFEGHLYIKHREEVEATFMVHNISELAGYFEVIAVSYVDSTMGVSKPDLHGYLYPRVAGDSDLNTFTHIRQRDASDLNSYFHVGGMLGAYYFII